MLHKNVQFVGSYKYSKYNIHKTHPTSWADQGSTHLKQVCISTITVRIMTTVERDSNMLDKDINSMTFTQFPLQLIPEQ